jgi:hypothetical protein
MFVCNRCGSSYNARHIGVEHCPRCRLRDKVEAPLAFKAFDLSSLRTTNPGPADPKKGPGSPTGTNSSSATRSR